MNKPFETAVDAVISGDIETLKQLLKENPALVNAQSSRDHKATLLHYLAANGVENERQKTPANAVEIMQLLIDIGAEVDALAETYGGGSVQTTLILLLTSAHPSEAGLQAKLTETLCKAGAAVNGLENNGAPLNAAIAFMYPPPGFFEHQYRSARESIQTLFQHGARIHDIYSAIAAGDLDRVQQELPSQSQKQLTRAWAYTCLFGHIEIAQLLLENGIDINTSYVQNQTGLHLAAGCGHLSFAQFLIEGGADITRRDDRYNLTPLEWAEKFGQKDVENYLRGT